MSRHRSRHRDVQVLYQIDMRQIAAAEAIEHYYDGLYSEEAEERPERDEFMEELVHGTLSRLVEVDQLISRFSDKWRVERMPAVDRNILRLAVSELLRKSLPPAVIIDEAISLAKRFSADESVGFMNGVLDSIRKDISGSEA
jgi:N utilization substance protein B